MLGLTDQPLNLRVLPSPLLIIGAAFSGKSDFAITALDQQLRAAFVGTADTSEPDIAALVARRRQQRPEHWQTFEAVDDLPHLLQELAGAHPQILVDSINQWVARLFVYAGAKHGIEEVEKIAEAETETICTWLTSAPKSRIVLVTSEIAAGLSPPTPTARSFRQAASRINCRLATACRSVVLVTAGIPLLIKGQPLDLA